MKLSGKLAIVTGGSRGIGRGIALDLSASGADVIITYNENSQMAEDVINEIKSKGQKGYAYRLNVRDGNGIKAFAEEVKKTFRNIDILV
ncbi:MAG: SDR family NAD(P)-dependent oxidoreductase, partial [Proteobacteria bacterium]|nr:SDR family NAD(P)-dependent oxidoreductase [Pseudomonadota bacterium]